MVALASGLLAAAVACDLQVAVVVDVEPGGSGTVEVSVGFDDAALERLGDPAEAFATDDLTAAGWRVGAPRVDADGLTWVTASKPFADPESFAVVVAEVTGPQGPLAGTSLEVDRDWISTTTKLTGVVDLSQGLEAFGDPGLTAALGGEPLGGLETTIATDEGRQVADMVGVTVTWTVGNQQVVMTPVLGGTPDRAVVQQRQWTPSWWLAVVAVGLGIPVVGVGVSRARTTGRSAVPPVD